MAQEACDSLPRGTYMVDSVTIADLEGYSGDTLTVKLYLKNGTGYEAVQCDVVLPRGCRVVEDIDPEFGDTTRVYAVGRAKLHGLISRVYESRSSTTMRLLFVDMNGRTIKAGDGVVAHFRIVLPEEAKTYACHVRKVVFSAGGDDLTLGGHGPESDFSIKVKRR